MGKLGSLPSRLSTLPSRLTVLPRGDAGRREASPWRAWYSLPRWHALRWSIFRRDGFTCQWAGCGRHEPSGKGLIADHKDPHRGDAARFWDPLNLWTLCKPCHDGPKQRSEQRGSSR